MKVELNKLSCEKCNHRWAPRKEDVRQCPNCKTAYFDQPRKEKEE